jgi:DNA-binding MarR family transcriptional regulator/GNAT superfamily N-acetyltransferase
MMSLGRAAAAFHLSMSTIPPGAHAARIEAVRAFNRFYTRRIGVLGEGLLDTRFTLTEARLLWELAHASDGGCTATDLARELKLDPGYLSRLIGGLRQRRLVTAARSSEDARQLRLGLSAAGRRAFAPLDARSQDEVAALLATLTEAQQLQLLQAMATLRSLVGKGDGNGDDAERMQAHSPLLLRPHQAGDIGWVVSRHGALYAAEYRWDQRFEALVARIAADFIDRFDARREACWIAERDGANVGSVFLVQARDDATQAPIDGTAQLRMLLVEPAARGLGLGKRLVTECERFARQAGYRRIMLWTNNVLLAARAIYARAGYRLVASEAHTSFGHAMVGETWELELR